jgi:nucleoside-diphosphate-sugar epimerase
MVPRRFPEFQETPAAFRVDREKTNRLEWTYSGRLEFRGERTVGTVLVTGGAGYIGSHIVKRLLEKEIQTVVLDNLQTGHREAIVGGTFVHGDMGDERILREVFAAHRIDSVIHMAADCLVGESIENPLKYFTNNISKGLKLLGQMLRHKVNKIVFSSSAAVYGNPSRVPIEEDEPPHPINPYGETKLIFERILESCRVAHGLQYISLRYFNAAGGDPDGLIGEDHHPETHLIPTVLRALLRKGRTVPIYGTDYDTPDGTCIRDYIPGERCVQHGKWKGLLREGDHPSGLPGDREEDPRARVSTEARRPANLDRILREDRQRAGMVSPVRQVGGDYRYRMALASNSPIWVHGEKGVKGWT